MNQGWFAGFNMQIRDFKIDNFCSGLPGEKKRPKPALCNESHGPGTLTAKHLPLTFCAFCAARTAASTGELGATTGSVQGIYLYKYLYIYVCVCVYIYMCVYKNICMYFVIMCVYIYKYIEGPPSRMHF